MKEVTSGAHYTTVTVDTEEEVKFSFASTSLSVEAAGGDITVALRQGAQAGDDETITVPDGESRMFIHHRMNVDTYYLTGSGTAKLYASNMGDVNPFSGKSKGGDGGGGGRTETVLWENEGTTNPDTITLSEPYTNFDEILLYNGGGFYGMTSNIYVQSVLGQGAAIGVIEDLNRRIWYQITSTTTLNKADEETIVLQRIIGIKYGSGGGTLGALAYKDTASGSYAPAGSVSVAQSPATYVYDGTTGLTTYTEAGAPSATFTGTTENITVG